MMKQSIASRRSNEYVQRETPPEPEPQTFSQRAKERFVEFWRAHRESFIAKAHEKPISAWSLGLICYTGGYQLGWAVGKKHGEHVAKEAFERGFEEARQLYGGPER